MGIVTTDNKYYSDIADAIREKNGESTLYLPAEMAPAILSIEGNSGYTVTVRHCGANAIVTARHGMTQETAIADANGVAVFEKLNKGVWFFTSPSRENAVAEILDRTDLDFESEFFNPSPNGLIICTAPIGSTVTATNGTTTFKAEKTLTGDSELHVFSIKPEYFSRNPITVTCVKASGSAITRETIVDSKKDVEVSFDQFYLIRDGVTLEPFLTSLTTTSTVNNYLKIAQTTNEHCYLHFPVSSLSGAMTVCCEIPTGVAIPTYIGGGDTRYGQCGMGITMQRKTESAISDAGSVYDVAYLRFEKSTYRGGLYSLPVTALSKDFFIGLDFEGSRNPDQYLAVKNLWIE